MNSESSNSKAFGNNFVIGWVVKTILAILAGAAVGGTAAQLLFCSHNIVRELLGSILLGIIVGAFVGVAQATHVRKVVRNSKFWLVASIAGWAIAVFLFEVNWPISRCLTSSNAPTYIPGPLIDTIHRPIFVLAGQIERMVKGEIIHGWIYNTITVFLMGFLMGVMLGLPQGIGQWLVLRKNLPRSSMLIWVNILSWATSYFLIVIVVELVNFNQILILMLIPLILIAPVAPIALVLVSLQTKQLGARC